IKDTLAYLRLVANRDDDAAVERAVNMPTRGIGERTLAEVRQRARTDGVSLWEAARRSSTGGTLAARARNALAGFANLVDALDAEVAELPLQEKIDHAAESKGSLDSRTDNLDELVSVASRFVQR